MGNDTNGPRDDEIGFIQVVGSRTGLHSGQIAADGAFQFQVVTPADPIGFRSFPPEHTAIPVRRSASYFAVQALGPSRRVLATSATIPAH